MASKSSILNSYKLDSVFDEESVVHTTTISGKEVKTRWIREVELGSGAFGVVWREREETSRELRALKIISKRDVNIREVEAMIALQGHSEFFILFLGWFEDPHVFYIAMEYIAHGDLGQYIIEYGEKAKSEVKEITTQILGGLVVLHEKEICHRDLKPQNILIASPSPIWVKISDFGISKRSIGTSLRTRCGTFCYQSPEQLGLLPKEMRSKHAYTKAVDIWALGAVVHEILASEIPFLDTYQESDSEMATTSSVTSTIDTALLFSYCHGSAPFPCESLQMNGVSEDGIDFVKSLMTVNPRDRVSATVALESLWLARAHPLLMDSPEPATLPGPECLDIAIAIADLPMTDLELLSFQFKQLNIYLVHEDVNRLWTEGGATVSDILKSGGIRSLQQKAIEEGFVQVVKVLLKAGDKVDSNNQSLALAARCGQVSVMKLILDHGAEVNAQIGGLTALQSAALGGHLDAIKFLLQSRADIHAAPARFGGRTALQAAAQGGHLDAVKFLVLNDAGVNAKSATFDGLTALQAAAAGGHLDVMRFLVHNGASISAWSHAGKSLTALQLAARGGHLDSMKYLVQNGAEINQLPSSDRGLTALQAAASAGHLGCVKYLVQNGADVNQSPALNSGLTALQAAVSGGYDEVVIFLLAQRAHIDPTALALAEPYPSILASLRRKN